MASVDTTRYSDLCRLCAAKTNMVHGINIFESEGTVRQICKKIETCLPVQIHEGDELPKMICENCMYKIELLFDFRERSLRTESLLIDLFKELNTLQLQEIKMDVAQLDHQDLEMVQQSSVYLGDHQMQNVNELELTQLAHRENMMVGHEIILTHQNVSLDNIELSHELNQELSNHSIHQQENILVSEGHMQTERYVDGMEYHTEHQILPEQYILPDINLAETNLQTHESDKNQHLTEDHSRQSDSQDDIKYDEIMAETKQVLKQEDSNSENRLLIDENKDQFVLTQKTNILTNTEKDWFCCNFCGKTFPGKLLFDEHYDEHFNKCTICPSVFESEESLNNHIKEVHNAAENETVTPIEQGIDKSSDGEGNADLDEDDECEGAETNTKKRKWSPKVCKECGKVYKTNYKLTEHMRKHTGEQPFKCKSCDKAFRSKIGLAQHEAKHTGQYDYSCSICGKGFQCKSYLMVHQRVHSDVKPYPCTTCGRNFKTKQSLLDHTNRHLGVKPYTCEICGRSFITNGLCKAHQKVHSGTDNRKYLCIVCNKMFVSKSYLQTHLRIHTGEKPFMCEVCGKGFLTRVDLKIHSTMHTGEKSYVCEMCGKAFARRDALRCHRRSHTGERPYSCEICGQTFTQFSPMAIHKRLHTGERPYECETCGKKFVSRSTMMVHSKKHEIFAR